MICPTIKELINKPPPLRKLIFKVLINPMKINSHMFDGIQAIFQSILEDSEGVIWFYFNKKVGILVPILPSTDRT